MKSKDKFGIECGARIPKNWSYPIKFAYYVAMEFPEILDKYNELKKLDE